MLERLLDDVLEKKERSRYWLAREIGVSLQNISKIAKGQTTGIDFDMLERLCEALECQPGDLFRYMKDDKSVKKGRK